MGSAFTPPPISALQPEAPPAAFKPPPVSSLQAEVEPSAASRLWDSFVGALPHPIDAIKEWAARPAEVGKAMDALHELNQLESQAKTDPKNQGKPRNEWVWPKGTPEQQQKIETGMQTQLSTPEGNALTDAAAPGVKAAKQVASGDVAGGFGTVLGGYGAPALAMAVAPGVAKNAPAAVKAVAQAASAAGPDVGIGAAKVAGAGTLGYVAHQLGLGQVVEYLAAKDLAKSGAKQIGSGLKAGYEAGKASLAPEPAPAPVRTPIWTGPPGRPATPADLTPIPGKLPSGRVPGGPAIDPATGEILQNVGGGEFSNGPVAPVNPRKAAFDAARAGKSNTPPPEAAPPASPAETPPQPSSPGTPGAATPPAPAGAIDAPAKLPPKLITEGQLGQYASDNGLSVDDAEARLTDQNVRVIDRVSLNRTLHAQVGDHETLSDIAKSTYKVDSLKKLSDEQMLELMDTLAKEQAAPAAEADSGLTAQMQESLAQARAKRAAGAKNLPAPASESPGKRAFNAARAKQLAPPQQ